MRIIDLPEHLRVELAKGEVATYLGDRCKAAIRRRRHELLRLTSEGGYMSGVHPRALQILVEIQLLEEVSP
jgi:hypothetical protein